MKNKSSRQWKIISVGGSIIIPPTGFDLAFLKNFRDLILGEVRKGQQFILVVGGGATARQYQAAGKAAGLRNSELDWVGIKATALNAEFVKFLFEKHAHDTVITDPTKKIKTSKKIIIAAGWKPGCSTDKDAVLLAKTYGAKEVINLSNIDYVYDSDPKLNPAATKIDTITWKEFRKIVGSKWSPGANVPFDPMAAKEAEKLKLTVTFSRGNDIGTLTDLLTKGLVKGTVIS